jgi:protein-L-isoaspartate(D-aspartate) O-methyltransferase
MSAGDIRRARMVRDLEARGIVNRRVLDAMGKIPREPFVEEAIGERQTISQPWIVARICELAEPSGEGRVLEIGSGSGYHAAVLSVLFDQVYSVERIASFSKRAREAVRGLGIENVHFKIFDGSYGWSEFAPYRAVVVTAAAPEIPAPLIEQLDDGGRLVIPVPASPAGDPEAADQVLVRLVKSGTGVVREEHGPCRFVPLVGKYGWTP